MPVRILVVDDEPNILATLAPLLRSRGYEVSTAMTGRGAVEAVERENPDLMVLDLGLPDMDGWEALTRMRNDPDTHGLRVVAFTAHAMVGDEQRALAAGFDGYLSKPIDFSTFPTTVGDLLP